MTIVTRLTLIALLSLFPACKREPSQFTTISWSSAGGIEAAIWEIDGQPAGKGVEGYNRVLKHLTSLADNALVRSRCPLKDWNETVEGFKGDDPFPFKQRDDLRNQFDALSANKHLTIQFVKY